MPIIIVQGSTKQDGKKIIKNVGEIEKKKEIKKRPPSRNQQQQLQEEGDDEEKKLSPSSSTEEFIPIKDIATNMADVVDFKVYRVSKPHFVDGTTTVNLVGGDLFYNEDEIRHFSTNKTLETGILKQIQSINNNKKDEKKKRRKGSPMKAKDLLIEDEDEDGNSLDSQNKPKLPTLLQKIRAFRHVSKKRVTKSLVLQRIEDDNERFRKVKAGQSLWKQIQVPTLEETLIWAVEYVNVNESTLIKIFVQLEESLKRFELELTTKVKSPDKLKGRPKGEELHKLRSYAAKTQNTQVHVSLLQQLENLKLQGTENFLKFVDGSPPINQSSRPSVLQLKKNPHPPGQASSSAPTKAVNTKDSDISKNSMNTKKRLAHQSHRHILSKDESEKFEEVPALEASKSFHHSVSTRSSIERIASIIPEFIGDNEVKDGESVLNDSNLEEDEIVFFAENATSDGNRSRFRSLSSDISIESEKEKSNQKEKDNSPRPPQTTTTNSKVPRPPANNKTSKSAPNKRPKVGFNLNNSMDTQNTPPRVGKSEPKEEGTSSPPKEQKTVKYSNANVEAETGGGASEINTATQQTIDVMRRGQKAFMKSMGYTISLFKRANQKHEEMEQIIQKKFQKITQNGNDLLGQFNTFQNMENDYNTKILQESKEKDLMKLSHIKAKIQFMMFGDEADRMKETTNSNNNNVSSSPTSRPSTSPNRGDRTDVQSNPPSSPTSPRRIGSPSVVSTFGERDFVSDFHKVRRNTKDYEEKQQLSLLFEVKWYLISIYKTRDFMKRMNNNMTPSCLIKLLLVFKYLIILQFPITVEIFYQLLLIPTIFQKDDLRKNIVQEVILEHIKTGLGISSEDFLRFLEENNFQIPPELLNDIRNHNLMNINNNAVTPVGRRASLVSPKHKPGVMVNELSIPAEVVPIVELPFDFSVTAEATMTTTTKEGLLASDV